jgi:simple sugar transport system substrate-binding protein
MADEDLVHEAVERLEWDERKARDDPSARRRQFTRRAALTGGAAGLAALALQACGGGSELTASASSGTSAAAGIFGVNRRYHFTFVNHATTNSFFTPALNGAADACKLLGCSYQWTGSQTSNVSEMVNALERAVTQRTNGIATTLIDPTAFNSPVSRALSAGVPVVAYNSDVPGNARLAYIGMDNYGSGQTMGQRIAALVPSGDAVHRDPGAGEPPAADRRRARRTQELSVDRAARRPDRRRAAAGAAVHQVIHE